MKYWMCAVDDRSDKTWTQFAKSKNHMVKFVEKLVTEINSLGWSVKYIRCDNAGEHQSALQDLCLSRGIILEYTAPHTPQQNARAEKKIHVVWQRAMTMQVNANLNKNSQKLFWREAVACSNFHEDLVIKSGRKLPAITAWTGVDSSRWIRFMVQFGRLGVVNKKAKLKSKMKDKGFIAMMVGYAPNHGVGVYRMYNPRTNRIIISRDVEWMEYKPRDLEKDLDIYEPGVESVDKPHTNDALLRRENKEMKKIANLKNKCRNDNTNRYYTSDSESNSTSDDASVSIESVDDNSTISSNSTSSSSRLEIRQQPKIPILIQTTHHNQTKQMYQQRQRQPQHRYQSQEPQE